MLPRLCDQLCGSRNAEGPRKAAAADARLRLIVAYKLAKAGGQLLLAAFLLVVLVAGNGEWGLDLAAALRRHVTGAWSLRLTELLAAAATPHAVELTICALLLDGLLTLCEGWALYRRFTWAPWLVVITTGSLLPFEVFELARRRQIGRLLIFLINVSVVWYLATRAAQIHRFRRSEGPPNEQTIGT